MSGARPQCTWRLSSGHCKMRRTTVNGAASMQCRPTQGFEQKNRGGQKRTEAALQNRSGTRFRNKREDCRRQGNEDSSNNQTTRREQRPQCRNPRQRLHYNLSPGNGPQTELVPAGPCTPCTPTVVVPGAIQTAPAVNAASGRLAIVNSKYCRNCCLAAQDKSDEASRGGASDFR